MQDFDAVVVGAGIIGIASAYHIQKNSPDKKVLVVERLGDAGQANTGRSNAMFRNTFTSIDNQVLANSAIDFYLHVQNDLGIDVGMDKVGYLWLMSEAQLSASERHVKKMTANGVEVKTYNEGELTRMVPGLRTRQESDDARLMSLPDISAGLFGTKCGRLAPEKLVGFYRDRSSGPGEGDVQPEREAAASGTGGEPRGRR